MLLCNCFANLQQNEEFIFPVQVLNDKSIKDINTRHLINKSIVILFLISMVFLGIWGVLFEMRLLSFLYNFDDRYSIEYAMLPIFLLLCFIIIIFLIYLILSIFFVLENFTYYIIFLQVLSLILLLASPRFFYMNYFTNGSVFIIILNIIGMYQVLKTPSSVKIKNHNHSLIL